MFFFAVCDDSYAYLLCLLCFQSERVRFIYLYHRELFVYVNEHENVRVLHWDYVKVLIILREYVHGH